MSVLTYEDILACEGLALVIDCETTGLHYYKDSIIGIGIHCPEAGVSGYAHTCTYEQRDFGKLKRESVWEGEKDFSKSTRGRKLYRDNWYQPQTETAVPSQVRIYHFLEAVQQIAANPNTTLIGHNLKFDAHFLELKLWQLPCKILDTSVMVHLIDCRCMKSLESAEADFLGTASKRSHISKADKKFGKRVFQWGQEVIEDYCVNDCIVTFQLVETLMPMIEEDGLTKLLDQEMDYLRLLEKIEHRGIKIEDKFCYSAMDEFLHNIGLIEQELYDAVGYEFNWRSSVALSKAIYENLGIEKPKDPFKDNHGNVIRYSAQSKIYTKTSTGTPLLVKHEHPLRSPIIDLRESDKLMKYANEYLTKRDEKGAIHASFNITGTITGRLSCSDPNLQQLAAKYRKFDIASEYTGGSERVGGYNLRRALCARKGYTIVSIDHKQQEVRLLAILSEEPTMLQYMRDRKDIHMGIALSVWGDCGSEQNKKHREWIKATVFGKCYGMSDDSLQEHFDKHNIEADAIEVSEKFFSTFSKLSPWFDKIREQTEIDGYTRYWDGRYWFPQEKGDEYKAVNAQIQGGAGEFLKTVLLEADKVLTQQKWGGILSIIHDEALYEIKDNCIDIAAPVLAKVMEGEWVFGVPFLTDIETGPSYGQLEPYEAKQDISKINWRLYV